MIDTDEEETIYLPGEHLALVTAEDYGQSGLFPHYGQLKPQSNYFNSNLNWHNLSFGTFCSVKIMSVYKTREQWVRIKMRFVVCAFIFILKTDACAWKKSEVTMCLHFCER